MRRSWAFLALFATRLASPPRSLAARRLLVGRRRSDRHVEASPTPGRPPTPARAARPASIRRPTAALDDASAHDAGPRVRRAQLRHPRHARLGRVRRRPERAHAGDAVAREQPPRLRRRRDLRPRIALAGGQALFDIANAGGSSIESEVMSFEVLHFCEGATLLKTRDRDRLRAARRRGRQHDHRPPGRDRRREGRRQRDARVPAAEPCRSRTRTSKSAPREEARSAINRSSQRVLPAGQVGQADPPRLLGRQAATDAIARVWPTIDPRSGPTPSCSSRRRRAAASSTATPTRPLGSECL